MILKALLIYSFMFTTFAQESESPFARPLVDKKKEEAIDSKLLLKGKVFQHPTPSEQCHEDSRCLEEAPKRCRSEKAKVESCSEIYSGSWVTNCECL